MPKVIALLERPDPQSMSIPPFVWSDECGPLRVRGYLNWESRVFESGDLQELVDGGHAYILPTPFQIEPQDSIGWLGEWFRGENQRLHGPSIVLNIHSMELPGLGRIWRASEQSIRRQIEDWISEAAKVVFSDSGSHRCGLADLMEAACPDDDRALAGIWCTRNPTEQRRHLELLVRLARDEGKPTDEDALVRRFKEIRNRHATHVEDRRGEFPAVLPRRTPTPIPTFG